MQKQKKLPTDLKKPISRKKIKNIVDTLVTAFGLSKSQAKRLIDQNAVTFDDKTITTYNYEIEKSGILRAGKKNIIHIEIK